jgi:hypothetical protein
MHPSPRPHRLAAPLLSLVALAISLAACSKHGLDLAPDQPPTVTITSGPIDTVSAPQSWLVDITWSASDPGRVDHFEYAIDPPRLQQARMAMAETAWVKTKESHVVAHFTASHPDSLGKPGSTASSFHVFVLRAIDDRGGISPDVVRAFYAYTVAPDAKFTDPAPNALLPANVGIPFRLAWSGNDPDGPGTGQPAMYRLRFLSLEGGQNITYVLNPDSLLRLGESNNWDGWRTVGGDTTSLLVDDPQLAVNTRWLVALVAVDDAGATTPYLTADRNLLVFNVLPTGGPWVHVFTNLLDYSGPPGGLAFSPTTDIPARLELTFNMEGEATGGRHITGTRWALDNENLIDTTPRSDEATDLTHWSQPHVGVITASFAFTDAGLHELGVQTFDDLGGQAALFMRFSVIPVTLDKDLLVVDDTRLEVDKFPLRAASPMPYTQPWPSRTEMDTFLFARGGFPWRGTQNPTTGAISPPGLLAGYAFDTLGTRLGLEDPTRSVTLTRLGQYRHVLWMVDAKGSQSTMITPAPITTLRAMCQPGVVSALAQYVQAGGQVWLAGGGAAYASLVAFDVRTNNRGQLTVFGDSTGELVPGRLLYDFAHIRSTLAVTSAELQVSRSPAAIGGWSGQGLDGTLSAPDYSQLPAAMRPRDPATDPMPPTRLASQAPLYYPTSFAAGFVIEPNLITEDFGSAGYPRLESALDTLYDVSGIVVPVPSAPVMTYYHGHDNAPFVYTGFDPWDWTRADCQGLFDFVLHDIWNLTKSAQPSRARASSASPTPRQVRPPAASRRAAVQLRR